MKLKRKSTLKACQGKKIAIKIQELNMICNIIKKSIFKIILGKINIKK